MSSPIPSSPAAKTDIADAGQEEVFSRTAIEQGLIRDPKAMDPKTIDPAGAKAGLEPPADVRPKGPD